MYHMCSAGGRAITCASFITTSTSIVSLVSDNPTSYSIYTMVQTVISATFTCTDDEKETLAGVTSMINEAVESVAEELVYVSATLFSMSGEYYSETEISSLFSVCTSDDDCNSLVGTVPPSTMETPVSMGTGSTASATSAVMTTVSNARMNRAMFARRSANRKRGHVNI